MAAAHVVHTLILGSVILFVAYIASLCSPKRPLAHKHWVPPNMPKYSFPTSPQLDRWARRLSAQSRINSVKTPAERVWDWLSNSENINSPKSDNNYDKSNSKRRWLLTPTKPKFQSTANLHPKGRWEGKPPNTFFPAREARITPKGKIRKPGVRFRGPNSLEAFASAPIHESSSPTTKNHPSGRIPELPRDPLARYDPLSMDEIDRFYDRLLRFIAGKSYNVDIVSAGNLRWAAVRTRSRNVDWDNYLEYREQRAEARERLKQAEQKVRTRDQSSLTKAQIHTLRSIDWSKLSVEDVYYAIAASTARSDPSAAFLTFISKQYHIRTDINWPYYLEYYLYRIKSPTKKSSPPSPASPTKQIYAIDNRGRPTDILGNEIKYARNKVGNTTPELDIEITMSGALNPATIPADEKAKHRVGSWAEDSSIANSADDLNDNVQPWRLIKGSKLPKYLWEHRRNVYARLNQPFIDALQRLNPPVRLDQYFITKAALLRVIALKDEIVARHPDIARLRNKRLADMRELELDVLNEYNQLFDANTIRLLIVFGGRLAAPGEDVAVKFNPYGLDDASFPECLRRMHINDSRTDLPEDEKRYWKNLDAQVQHYWKTLWTQAGEYWQSVRGLIEASRIIYEREENMDDAPPVPSTQTSYDEDGEIG